MGVMERLSESTHVLMNRNHHGNGKCCQEEAGLPPYGKFVLAGVLQFGQRQGFLLNDGILTFVIRVVAAESLPQRWLSGFITTEGATQWRQLHISAEGLPQRWLFEKESGGTN